MAPAARAGQAPRRRVFFALWSTERLRQRLIAAVAPLLAGVPGRPVAPADWHVTLCFLGAVDELVLGSLQAGAGQIDAGVFALQFDGIEYWQRARVITITAAVVPQPAQDLAAALRDLARSAALTPEERPLRPHVTLMRGVSARAWRDFCAGADQPGHTFAAGWAASGQGGPTDLTLEARELHLAESREPANAPAALPAGGGAPPPPRRGGRAVRAATLRLRTGRCGLKKMRMHADWRRRHLWTPGARLRPAHRGSLWDN
jgi:2'-5' RNA ligase